MQQITPKCIHYTVTQHGIQKEQHIVNVRDRKGGEAPLPGNTPYKRIRNAGQNIALLLGLQESWNKRHHIWLEQIDYLDVAGTVCASTVMYGRLLSQLAIHTARSEHPRSTMHTVMVTTAFTGWILVCDFPLQKEKVYTTTFKRIHIV